MYLCSNLFQNQSVSLHLNHIQRFVNINEVGALCLLVDKGIDNNFEKNANFFQYGRFWKNSKLDVLVGMKW